MFYIGRRVSFTHADDLVVFIDPLNPKNNVARSSFRFQQVQQLFSATLKALVSQAQKPHEESET